MCLPSLKINKYNMSFELIGTLIAKNDTQVISDKFKKREFVIETKDGGNYSNFVKLQLTQAKVDLIDGYTIGDDIKVGFDIKGTRYEKNGVTSYFTNLDAWRIGKASGEASNSVSAGQFQAPPSPGIIPDAPTSFISETPFDNDLPF